MRRRTGVLIFMLLAACTAARSPQAPVPTAPSTADTVVDGDLANAVRLIRAGENERARAILLAPADTDSILADYHLHLLALVEHRDGRADTAAELDARLLDEHPRSVWLPHVFARGALRARDRRPDDAAALVARSLTHADADAESRGLALLVRSELYAPTRPREAYGVLQDVRRLGGWAAGRARERCRELERVHPALLADVELQLAEAEVRAAEGHRDRAVERLESLAERAPEDARGEILLALARMLRLAERHDEAIAVLRRAVALDPSPDNPARLQLAYRLWSQDRNAEARTLFEALLAERPQHPARAMMEYALALIAEESGDLIGALEGYRRVAQSRDRSRARSARWRLGWAPYRAGNLAAALAGFRAVERSGDDDRSAAIYWQARIHEQRDDADTAAARYETVLLEAPRGYYGGLAEERLGRPAIRSAPAALPSPPPARLTAGSAHWRRRTALLDAGLEPFAAREVAAWARGLPARTRTDPSLLAAWTAVGAHAQARTLAHRLARQGTLSSAARLRYDYPRAHWRHVSRLAAEHDLDPFLILAVMRQESLFDAGAVSPVSARGLMQLMPATAARLAGQPVDLLALTDPATNIALGARYLRQLLDRYGGRLPRAVAAYNAGEPAVDKWIARTGDVAPDEFVESISYRETRTYVKTVLANLRRYHQLYRE